MKILNTIYKISSKLNKNIVLISDLHFSDKRDINRLNIILDDIKKIKNDYICISGDITNKSKVNDEDIFIDWLERLSKINKVIISIGNHEFYIDKSKEVFGLNNELLKKISKINNVYLLNNSNIVIDNINFIGVTVPIDYYLKKRKDFYKCLNNLNYIKDKYNILLCHSPEYICNKDILKDRNIDLIFCGHMHGGAVPTFLRPIFKTRGFISPKKTLFPKNAYGHIKINNTDIIITSGTKVLPLNRFSSIFKPEVVKIKKS